MNKIIIACFFSFLLFGQDNNQTNSNDNQIVINNNVNTSNSKNNEDYYNDGVYAAKVEFKSKSFSTFTVGTLSGIVLPVISWTIGNLIVKNLPVKIPKNYTLDIPSSKKAFFEDGYKDLYKEKRKKKFKQGATLGTLILIGGVAASNTE